MFLPSSPDDPAESFGPYRFECKFGVVEKVD
jgi:hypothetical protein